MLVYAGIDEAGYGPLLGPLCVACAAFEIEEPHGPAQHPGAAPPDLWTRLGTVVCRRPGDRRQRIAIDDSKRLKAPAAGPHHPLCHLERGVLSFCAADAELPSDDQALFERLGIALPGASWYATSTPLPVGHAADELRITRSRLRRCLAASEVRGALLSCEAIDAGSFNDQCRAMGSKAAVNWCAAMRLLGRLRQRSSGARLHIAIDRHGGRLRYREPLEQSFPGAALTVIDETDAASTYRLDGDGPPTMLSFIVEGESIHLPVALASMTAKYVRELLMLRLNRFFAAHLPGLRPTAGYVADGRRYLAEIKPLMARLGVDHDALVRRR